MLQSNQHQPSILDSSALIQVDQKEMSIVPRDEMKNGVPPEIRSIIYSSKNLEDDLQMLGMKIKQHEENKKMLNNQKNKLEDSILDMQGIFTSIFLYVP
uniref:Protein DEFECTIVE IN MERISTEM SILENCING 3 n=1 Tax=Rhizophora mucronata TaxID=61149 RepID=A0A2P2KHU1_RHIMU